MASLLLLLLHSPWIINWFQNFQNWSKSYKVPAISNLHQSSRSHQESAWWALFYSSSFPWHPPTQSFKEPHPYLSTLTHMGLSSKDLSQSQLSDPIHQLWFVNTMRQQLYQVQESAPILDPWPWNTNKHFSTLSLWVELLVWEGLRTLRISKYRGYE